MTYAGKVKGGVVVLERGAKLAEGMRVTVSPVPAKMPTASRIPSLAKRLKNVIGKGRGLPVDLSENHDFYIHGAPKRKK